MDELPDRQNRNMIHDSKKYEAINSLVHTIKSNDFSNSKYQITNHSDNADDVLFVRIPMPQVSEKMTQDEADKVLKFDVVDTNTEKTRDDKKLDSFDDLFLISVPKNRNNTESQTSRTPKRELHSVPVVRRGFVTRTNRTGRRRRIRPESDSFEIFS